jgi:hypothetical protein
MKLTRQPDGWWIVDLPHDTPDCGPYDSKSEASDDLHGMQRTFEWLDQQRAKGQKTS